LFLIFQNTFIDSFNIFYCFSFYITILVLRENGNERFLSQEDIDTLVKDESTKVDNGTSNLTNPNGMGNLSLGEALLASAAGAIIGSYIGNKLFGNQNYQANRQSSYKNPSTYSRSVDSFKKARSTTSSTSSSTKRTGFFGSSRTSSSRSFFGG